MPSRTLQTPIGEVFETERLLDYGEHAEVWLLKGRADLVAKVYWSNLPDEVALEAKLRAMIAAPPEASRDVAWPIALLYESNRLAGYLMPRIASASAVHYGAEAMRARARDFPRESTRDVLLLCAELARTVARIHQAGHAIGNFSFEVLLWRTDGGLALIGTETFCIRAPDGTVHRPLLPPQEFLAPEIRSADPDSIGWSTRHDAYALAVHLQHLLQEHEKNLPRQVLRALNRIARRDRPSVAEWGALLETAAAEMVECTECGFVFPRERRRCPRCSAMQPAKSRSLRRTTAFALAGVLLAGALALIPWWRSHRPAAQEPAANASSTQRPTMASGMQPGHRYLLALQIAPGSPHPQLAQRGDDRILLELRGDTLAATWPTGNAILAPTDADTFEQKPNPAPWLEGWRDIRLTFAPEREWDAIYRVPWTALGLSVREAPGVPRLAVAALAAESPASEGELVIGERIALPELRTVAEPTETQFRSALEKLAGSAVTLRVFSGEPARVEGYIASGEFRPKMVAGEYLKVEAVGGGSRAELVGLRAGDLVTSISGQSTRLLTGPAIDKLLNRNVTLEVYREKQVRTVVLARDKRLRVGFAGPDLP